MCHIKCLIWRIFAFIKKNQCGFVPIWNIPPTVCLRCVWQPSFRTQVSPTMSFLGWTTGSPLYKTPAVFVLDWERGAASNCNKRPWYVLPWQRAEKDCSSMPTIQSHKFMHGRLQRSSLSSPVDFLPQSQPVISGINSPTFTHWHIAPNWPVIQTSKNTSHVMATLHVHLSSAPHFICIILLPVHELRPGRLQPLRQKGPTWEKIKISSVVVTPDLLLLL